MTDELKTLYSNIMQDIERASRSIIDKQLDPQQALDLIKLSEKSLLQFGAKARVFTGPEGQIYQKQFQEMRQKLQITKTQLTQLQMNSIDASLVADMNNQAVLSQKQDNLKIMQQTAVDGMQTANNLAGDINEEVVDQNEKIASMAQTNERINKGLKKGINLADLIKCTEVKHMYAQAILIAFMLAFSIAAIVVRLVL
ncbi:Hypothetical_protein [Hexamita inflata]|uniref:Hypothetical_protein n=1 Tax=Hexamita inflata TaxID=28002 RepID=A0AA86NYJ3_9EUKA|nr:Hypothetical protein HINF_LOCUS14771 [Hexamita inflata]